MPLVEKLLILAMAVQAFLAIGLVTWLGFERVPRVSRGEIKMADIAVDRTGYPLKARLLSNSFDNQFQLPVLFFVGALLLLHLGLVVWVDVLLAWLFIALRITHAIIHVRPRGHPPAQPRSGYPGPAPRTSPSGSPRRW